MEFDKDNLTKLAEGKTFRIWHYSADKSVSNAARSQPGFFPSDQIKVGDVVYISGDGKTTHHWFDVNRHDNLLTLQLFG